MVNLEALREALAPINQVGVIEEIFDIQGTQVVLRPLKPAQETEVQRWAGQVMADAENEDQATGIEYLDRFKIGCLSYAICEIGGLDLRETEVIPTGQTLPNGTEVKVPKHKGLRDLLKGWTRPVIDSCFRKFGEMMEKAELQVENSVVYDPVDLDSEMGRLEERLERLKELQARRKSGDVKTPVSKAMTDALSGKTEEEAVQAVVDEAERDVQAAEKSIVKTTVEGGQTRRSVLPSSANPIQPMQQQATPTPPANADHVGPSSADIAAELGAQQAHQTQPVNENVEEEATPENTVVSASGTVAPALPNEGWVDSSDSDALKDAVAAENMRLTQLRMSRNPPHAKINNPDVPVMDPNQEKAAVPTESTPSTDTRNPKFVPPGKR